MVVLKFIRIIFLLCLFFNTKSQASKNVKDSEVPSPIILVPGLGGSRAYSNLNFHLFTIRALVWVNFEYMAFPTLLRNVFELTYDPKTHKTSDAVGSQVFFPGWGSTETIEDLDERKHTQTTYYSPLVESLIQDKYYIRNKTVRGAPYDFRKAPNENDFFVPALKNLVEETYKITNNQKVVILGHSLGSLYTLYFMKKMTIPWKKQFLRAFISVSAPLGGAAKALVALISGENLGSPRSPIYFRDMQRSFPSSYLLLPQPELFGKNTIVIAPKRNYSAYDYKALFKDLSMANGPVMYDDTKNLVNGQETPEGIDEIYCVHGYGVQTTKQVIYKSFPDEQPEIINGDGDATVNIDSLEICKKWKNVQHYSIKDANHLAILGVPDFLVILKKILYRNMTLPLKV